MRRLWQTFFPTIVFHVGGPGTLSVLASPYSSIAASGSLHCRFFIGSTPDADGKAYPQPHVYKFIRKGDSTHDIVTAQGSSMIRSCMLPKIGNVGKSAADTAAIDLADMMQAALEAFSATRRKWRSNIDLQQRGHLYSYV